MWNEIIENVPRERKATTLLCPMIYFSSVSHPRDALALDHKFWHCETFFRGFCIVLNISPHNGRKWDPMNSDDDMAMAVYYISGSTLVHEKHIWTWKTWREVVLCHIIHQYISNGAGYYFWDCIFLSRSTNIESASCLAFITGCTSQVVVAAWLCCILPAQFLEKIMWQSPLEGANQLHIYM
jgi:hypothetical protein